MKPIVLSAHAAGYMARRGFTEQDVVAAITTGEWQPVPGGRFESRMVFAFGRDWNGKHYESRQVRPVFVDEPDSIVVVTVYTYYY